MWMGWAAFSAQEDEACVERPRRPRNHSRLPGRLELRFQKGQSKGLNAVYHFTFTGHEEVKATVTIRDEKLQVSEGHNGQADLRLTADSETWLRFLRKEANIVWALLRRKIRIQGSPKLLLALGRCFPS
jgi:putative sterol carrier protein